MKIETVNMDSIPYILSKVRCPDVAKILVALPRLPDGEVLKCAMEDVRGAEKLFVALKYYRNSEVYPGMQICRRKNLVFVWKEPTQE